MIFFCRKSKRGGQSPGGQPTRDEKRPALPPTRGPAGDAVRGPPPPAVVPCARGEGKGAEGGTAGVPEGTPGVRNPPADSSRTALFSAPRSPSVPPTRKTSTIPRKETAPERVPNRSNAEIARKWAAADQKRGQRIRVVSPAAAFAFLRVMATFPPRPRFLSDPRLGAQEEVEPGRSEE